VETLIQDLRFGLRMLAKSPAALVATPKLERRLPHPMTRDEVESLLDSAFGKNPLDRRDRAILELLYATGIRVGETVGADLGDLEIGTLSEDGMLRVLGKGRKERLVPIGMGSGGGALKAAVSATVRPKAARRILAAARSRIPSSSGFARRRIAFLKPRHLQVRRNWSSPAAPRHAWRVANWSPGIIFQPSA